MLSGKEIERYRRDGYIIVQDVFSREEVEDLRAVTDEFVERTRGVSSHDDVYDLEPSHTSEEPRVRRIKDPHRQHPTYAKAVAHPTVVEILRDLLGQAVKFKDSKLNMKAAGFGSAVEWHQDWAFYPHTNDDLCAVGIMLDDCAMENGPLLIVPGSHTGPIFDHHADGRFCGAIDLHKAGLDVSGAHACTGPAGSISVHHVRAVHGSAPNRSNRTRRLLLGEYRAADAWPLLPAASLTRVDSVAELEEEGMLAGEQDPLAPRLTPVPVRLPLPGAEHSGSIYEKQRGLGTSYFQ